jgi:hypothetical protein
MCAHGRSLVHDHKNNTNSQLDVEGVMLQAQVQAAKTREETLLGQHVSFPKQINADALIRCFIFTL